MKNKCRFKLNKTNCTYWEEFGATCPAECPNSIVPQNLPKANASSQLYEVRELGEALCDMEKYIPDESSALGEKFKIVVEKYNKVSEHFV